MSKVKLTLGVTKDVREKLDELSAYNKKSISKMVEDMAIHEHKRMKRKMKKDLTKGDRRNAEKQS